MIPFRSRRALPDGYDDDRILERTPTKHVRWHLVLIWFMRVCALVWFAKGLLAWAAIIGVNQPVIPFEGRTMGFQAVTIYFAVIDLVAAVGLWLIASWGGVMWLLAVMSHLILAAFFPRFIANGSLLFGLFIGSIVVYLVISWLAEIDE